MRKIISQVLLSISIFAFGGCTAYDELPSPIPGSLQKRIKKSPDLKINPARDHLAV